MMRNRSAPTSNEVPMVMYENGAAALPWLRAAFGLQGGLAVGRGRRHGHARAAGHLGRDRHVRLGLASFGTGGGRVDATGKGLVGAKGEYPF
jgi:hypothetical protein